MQLSAIDIQRIREDFPILHRKNQNGIPLVYLDSSATSQKPNVVIESMDAFYRNSNANIHRGIHFLAEEATALHEKARQKVANFIGTKDTKELIFTRNTTEAINLVAHSWGRRYISAGDMILLTEMEHHANLVPWFMLAEEKQCKIEYIPITDDGLLDLDTFRRLLEKEPSLVAFTHMSNVLGTINPAKEIISMAHAAGALVLVDGAQSVPHFSVDVKELDADFYAFSSHKMLGPSGIGALYGKMALLESMPPFMGGGDMIRKVTLEGFKTNDLPFKFEAGTPAIAEAIGFGTAIDYLIGIGMQIVQRHEQDMTREAMKVIGSISGIRIIGPRPELRGGVLAFDLAGIHPHDVAQILDGEGIAVRAGHHCAMPVHQKFGLPASTRASFYIYNNVEEISKLAAALEKAKALFR